jgi:hypothetical protein
MVAVVFRGDAMAQAPPTGDLDDEWRAESRDL